MASKIGDPASVAAKLWAAGQMVLAKLANSAVLIARFWKPISLMLAIIVPGSVALTGALTPLMEALVATVAP